MLAFLLFVAQNISLNKRNYYDQKIQFSKESVHECQYFKTDIVEQRCTYFINATYAIKDGMSIEGIEDVSVRT